MEVRSTAKFRRPKDVRILSEAFISDGMPLFNDLSGQEVYVSDRYDKSQTKMLKKIGVQEISMDEMYARIEADVRSATPRHKRLPFRDDWHMSFLSLVSDMSADQRLKQNLLNFDIIPLAKGDWCAPNASDKACLPYVELDERKKLELPGNIGMRKLHPDACVDEDPDFERLYCALGVARNTLEDVVARIGKLHASYADCSDDTLSAWRNRGSVKDWVLNYEILFWQGPTPSQKWNNSMIGVDTLRNFIKSDRLYFQSEAPYDAYTLLNVAKATQNPVMAGYGFLADDYAVSEMRNSRRSGKTWDAWLKEVPGVRCYPPLVATRHSSSDKVHSLHPHLKYVGENNAGTFVALLQAHWHESYKAECDYDGQMVMEQISKLKVPCDNGLETELTQSILPTQEVMAVIHKHGLDSVAKRLFLLTLPTTLTTTNEQDWTFLERFGVLTVVNKHFWIRVLAAVKASTHVTEELEELCILCYSKLTGTCTLEDRNWLQNELLKSNGNFLPGDAHHLAEWQWASLDDCIWAGPSVLKTKLVLQHRYKNQEAAQKFFQGLLSLPDATCDNILNDLLERSQLHDEDSVVLDMCKELYAALALLIKDPKNFNMVVTKFRGNALIYVSGSWYQASKCVWNGRVSTLQSLETLYPRLRSFFVDRLGIKVMSSKVVWAELVELCKKGSDDVVAFKNLVITLSQTLLNEKKHDHITSKIKELEDFAFLPLSGSPRVLAKVTTDFCIVDNEKLGNRFKGKLQVLDFTSEELAISELFFQLLGLECRYLTKCVRTQVVVGDHEFNENLSEHIRHRAYALSRCAIAHRSLKFLQRNRTTYDIISRCKVYSCKDLETRLVINQNRYDVSVRSEKPAIKVDMTDGVLSIFAPHEPAALISCQRTDLPKHLMRVLGIQISDAERQVYRILEEDDEKLDVLLQQEDLPEVTWLQPPEPRKRPRKIIPQEHGAELPSSDHSNIVAGSREVFELPVRTGTNLFRTVLGDNGYEEFLASTVIPQAKGESASSTHLSFTSASGDEGLYKIGVAGELFVFEQLKSLGLPRFTADNWKSNIRHLVNVVPGYDLSRWTQGEVADFEYLDVSGVLADFLEKHSHNKPLAHIGLNESQVLKPIKFLIEVKTAPGRCEMPFFVSENQYGYMKQYRLQPDVRPEVVYVVFRVYNLFSRNIKFKIFVDPWSLKDGMLQFTADEWKVVGPVSEASSEI